MRIFWAENIVIARGMSQVLSKSVGRVVSMNQAGPSLQNYQKFWHRTGPITCYGYQVSMRDCMD